LSTFSHSYQERQASKKNLLTTVTLKNAFPNTNPLTHKTQFLNKQDKHTRTQDNLNLYYSEAKSSSKSFKHHEGIQGLALRHVTFMSTLMIIIFYFLKHRNNRSHCSFLLLLLVLTSAILVHLHD